MGRAMWLSDLYEAICMRMSGMFASDLFASDLYVAAICMERIIWSVLIERNV